MKPDQPRCLLPDLAMKVLGSPAALIGRLVALRITLDWLTRPTTHHRAHHRRTRHARQETH